MKGNKQKHRFEIPKAWRGGDVFRYFSHKLGIPLENIRCIHKGKLLNEDTVLEKITNGAVFLVPGETGEDESKLNVDHIDLVMKQLNVDRNEAVRALNLQSDVTDALLYIANKK